MCICDRERDGSEGEGGDGYACLPPAPVIPVPGTDSTPIVGVSSDSYRIASVASRPVMTNSFSLEPVLVISIGPPVSACQPGV